MLDAAQKRTAELICRGFWDSGFKYDSGQDLAGNVKQIIGEPEYREASITLDGIDPVSQMGLVVAFEGREKVPVPVPSGSSWKPLKVLAISGAGNRCESFNGIVYVPSRFDVDGI